MVETGFIGRLRNLSPVRVLMVTAVFAVLLVLSFIVEIRVIVKSPEIGEISRTVEIFWQLATGTATLVALLLTVYNTVEPPETETESSGPETSVEINRPEGDVQVFNIGFDHLEDHQPSHGPDSLDLPESETDSEDENERDEEG